MNIGKAFKGKFAGKANIAADNFTADGKKNVIGWGMPNYSAVIELSKQNGTTTQKGFLVFKSSANFYAVGVYIGSLPLLISGSYSDRDCLIVQVDEGTTYSCDNWGVISNLYFVPVKGS